MPRLKRRDGKSVTMRHLISPRMPCAESTWATTRNAGACCAGESSDGEDCRSVGCGANGRTGSSAVSACWLAPTESEALLDDVEVDSRAFTRGSGFDEGSEATDDSALTADDFTDVFFVDFELVDRGVAILNLVDFDGRRFVDERSGDVFDQPLQVGLELFELFCVFQLFCFFTRFAWGGLGFLLGHGLGGGRRGGWSRFCRLDVRWGGHQPA